MSHYAETKWLTIWRLSVHIILNNLISVVDEIGTESENWNETET